MKSPRIDLNLFVVFDAIYSQQSLTRAAGVLHVSQPAVSNALARLRQALDDPLFVRSNTGMSPTPLARQLIVPIRESLKNLESCVQLRRSFDPASARQTIRLHATEHAEMHLLPQLLNLLEKAAPGIDLEVVFTRRRDIPVELAGGNLQLAIDAPLINSGDLLTRLLSKDHYVCVMRPDHPLAGSNLQLEDFLAYRHVHISSRSRGSGHVDLALRAVGEQRRIGLRLQHYAGLQAVLHQSDYLAAVPASLAQQWTLSQKPLPFEASPLELHMFWHKGADHDPTIMWLRDTIMGILPPQQSTH